MKTTTDGLVIWEHRTGEADRVITLLTPNGVVSAYAKGSLRPRSRLATATGMLSYSDFELFPGANMYTVDDVQLRHRFARLSADALGYALAVYFCELLKLLAPVEDDAGDFMSLTLNTLHLINECKKDRDIIKSVFELRIASYAGYLPDLECCRVCGEPRPGGVHLDIINGSVLCPECAGTLSLPLNCPASVLAALRHIVHKPLAAAFSFELGAGSLARLASLSEQYIIARLERLPATLEFYRKLK